MDWGALGLLACGPGATGGLGAAITAFAIIVGVGAFAGFITWLAMRDDRHGPPRR